MGSSLAQLFLQSGFNVQLVENHPQRLTQAVANVRGGIEIGVSKWLHTERQAVAMINALSSSADLNALADAALVIEAIYENLVAKQELLVTLEKRCAPHTLFATNTSSFRLVDLATNAAVARRLLGLHYFYPP